MLSTIDSGTLRVILRVYFIVCLFFLGIIGRQCGKLAVKRDLLDGHQVRIHRMTGWLKSEAILSAIWKLRQLPGGWFLGLLMIIASLISLTADVIVAKLVVSESASDLCPFTQGLVMDWTDSESFSYPPSNSWVATLASNAQYISLGNGDQCQVGIYRKIPGDQIALNDFYGNTSTPFPFQDITGYLWCSA
jgi:hypothetical protein